LRREISIVAKIVLIGLEQAAGAQICSALAVDDHQIEHQRQDVAIRKLLDADIVFAGGDAACYMPLLSRIREARPTLPFIVVTRIPETTEWINALEAGATDYCSVPIEARQLQWLMECALPGVRN